MRTILIYAGFIVSVFCTSSFPSDIHDAAGSGDLPTVKELLIKSPELIHETTDSGNTPLHFACTGESLELVGYLLDSGAAINALNESHFTPLHYAAYYNRPGVIRLLADRKADIEARDREEQTPLHAASASGNTAAVRALLEKGAAVNAKNEYLRTPLVLVARESGNIESAKLLLDKGANIDAVDTSGKGALDLAAWRGFNEFINFLLGRGVGIPASNQRRIALLNHCLERRLDELLDALVKAGLDLKALRESDPSLILAAASGGSSTSIDVLNRNGFDLNFNDRNGWTPLHFAAEFGRTEAVRYLLDNGARINARTVLGQSAYNIAREEQNGETADVLVERRAETAPPLFPNLQGAYLGQKTPGSTPALFAPGIVSARYDLHSSVAFSPAGDVACWTVMKPPRESGYGRSRILWSTLEDGRWTYPVLAEFQGTEPFFAPDGKRLYFLSREPLVEGKPSRKENIWYVKRLKSGWSSPQPVDPIVNSAPLHWQFSIDSTGTFYLDSGDGRILVSQFKDDKYQRPVDFTELHGNSSVRGGCPYISPAGDYLIFSAEGDLRVTFRNTDGSWTVAEELGETVNSADDEMCPLVSPDGKYLFFIATRDGNWGPHWVAFTDLLGDLRKNCRQPSPANSGRHKKAHRPDRSFFPRNHDSVATRRVAP